MSNVYPFLPKLTMNGQFIRDFIAEESPCFALGLVEERKQQCGFLALRPDEVIPPEISAVGFNFGHALLGTAEFEVIQFAFQFYGFETYNVLVNPNNHLVKRVLLHCRKEKRECEAKAPLLFGYYPLPSARPQLRISVLAASPSDAHWYSAIASAQISLMRQFSGQGTFKRSQLAPPLTE